MTTELITLDSDNILSTGRTFGSLKTSIANWINKNNLTNIIPDLIKISQLRLERKNNWSFMEGTLTGSLALNEYSFDLPARYKESDFLHLTYSDVVLKLKRKSEDYCMNAYPSPTLDIGEPELFYVNQNTGKVVIRPTCDQAYDYKLKFYGFTSELSADTDYNWWVTNAWDVLLFQSLVLAEPYLRNDVRMSTWKNLLDEALKDIEKYMIDESISGSSRETDSMYLPLDKGY